MSPRPSIAHYRIVSKFGEGGMGAVYRATDTKLNRDVAIKVLPDSFAREPDRMARFERESQVLAARMVKILDLFEFNHGCGLNTLSQGKHPKQT